MVGNRILIIDKAMSLFLFFVLYGAGKTYGIKTSSCGLRGQCSISFRGNATLANLVRPYDTLISQRVLDFLKDKKLEPLFIYDNILPENLEQTRQIFLKDTKNLSGIYLILNKVTLDYYIGSASTNKFNSRFINHLISLKGSKIIKNAVKKYKLNCFAFIILELFPEVVTKENNKELLDLEDFYLKTLLPNYNILTEAGNSFGYKHTEIDRIKMKSIYSTERRELIGKLNRAKTLFKENIEEIRQKALGRILNKENIYALSLSNMKKTAYSKPVTIFNLDFTVFGKYSSIVEASKALNCNAKTIRRALKTRKQILKRRYIVQFSYPPYNPVIL